MCNSPWLGLLKVNELQEDENVSYAEINLKLSVITVKAV